MADYGFQLFGSRSPCVGQIDFVMQSGSTHIVYIAVLGKKLIHLRHGCGLIIVGTNVHHLDAQTFVDGDEFRCRAIELFLVGVGGKVLLSRNRVLEKLTGDAHVVNPIRPNRVAQLPPLRALPQDAWLRWRIRAWNRRARWW